MAFRLPATPTLGMPGIQDSYIGAGKPMFKSGHRTGQGTKPCWKTGVYTCALVLLDFFRLWHAMHWHAPRGENL